MVVTIKGQHPPPEGCNEARNKKACARCGKGTHPMENCLIDASQIEKLNKVRQKVEESHREKERNSSSISKVRTCAYRSFSFCSMIYNLHSVH